MPNHGKALAGSLSRALRQRLDELAPPARPAPASGETPEQAEIRDALRQARAALSVVTVQLRRAFRALPEKT